MARASAPPSSVLTTITVPSLSKFYNLRGSRNQDCPGAVVERPAWEDLITVENLRTRLEELDAQLDSLRSQEDRRSE
jgi:hypothetical protein